MDIHIFGSLGFLVIVWVHFLVCNFLFCCFFIFQIAIFGTALEVCYKCGSGAITALPLW